VKLPDFADTAGSAWAGSAVRTANVPVAKARTLPMTRLSVLETQISALGDTGTASPIAGKWPQPDACQSRHASEQN
jgi:hypothetical protein